MGFKNFLAAFFILVFLSKLVTIDAKLVAVVFDNSQVILVNKACPKKQLKTGKAEEFIADDPTPGYEIDYQCHSAFDLQIEHSSKAFAENNFRKYSYLVPGEFSVPGEKLYPPPKA